MGEDSRLEVRQVIGDEIFVGVERGGPVGGGEGGAVCGGEDGFDEVFGGADLRMMDSAPPAIARRTRYGSSPEV